MHRFPFHATNPPAQGKRVGGSAVVGALKPAKRVTQYQEFRPACRMAVMDKYGAESLIALMALVAFFGLPPGSRAAVIQSLLVRRSGTSLSGR